MRVLKDTGLSSLEPVDVAGQKVRPRDLTAAPLFPRWTFDEGEANLTVLRVRVVGHEAGRRLDRVLADLVARGVRCRASVAPLA